MICIHLANLFGWCLSAVPFLGDPLWDCVNKARVIANRIWATPFFLETHVRFHLHASNLPSYLCEMTIIQILDLFSLWKSFRIAPHGMKCISQRKIPWSSCYLLRYEGIDFSWEFSMLCSISSCDWLSWPLPFVTFHNLSCFELRHYQFLSSDLDGLVPPNSCHLKYI